MAPSSLYELYFLRIFINYLLHGIADGFVFSLFLEVGGLRSSNLTIGNRAAFAGNPYVFGFDFRII